MLVDRLQARRHIDGVAVGGVVEYDVAAHVADDHGPRMDADAGQADRQALGRLFLGEPVGEAVHFDGASQRTVGMVGLFDRCVEKKGAVLAKDVFVSNSPMSLIG